MLTAAHLSAHRQQNQMRTDSRLSRMLHVLLHMARHDQPFTSEQLAGMLFTNAAVVRRTMAGLRRAGYVRSEKGHSGGWTIACDLDKVSLLDIHKAVGGPKIFAIGVDNEHPECAVERAVNASLKDAFEQAEALLTARLQAITLADLAEDFDARCAAKGMHTGHPESD